MFGLIRRRIKSFLRLKSVFLNAAKVSTFIKEGAGVYIHPIVPFKIGFRLISAPFFRLESILLPGELSFEKKINKLVSTFKTVHRESGQEIFDFVDFRLLIPNFKNADKVLLNDFREVYFENVYAKHFPNSIVVKENDIVLDIGANIGIFSLWVRKQAKGVKVFAIEPHPKIYQELLQNIELNKVEGQVFPIQRCVSNKEGQCQLTFDEEVFTMTRIGSAKDSIETDVITIDALVVSEGLNQVDIIKLDIEGAERMALAGARKTITNFKPKLALSGYHLIDDVYYLVNQILEMRSDYRIVVGSNMHIYAF